MTLQLTYRKVTIYDFEDLFLIKCDKANVQWGGFVKKPNRQQFFEWFSEQLKSSFRIIYLVYEHTHPCGFFYIDKVNDTTYELSSSGVLSEYSGKGIGTYTVQKRLEIIQALGGRTCITWISEHNIASYRRFIKEGFTRTNEYEIRNLPLLGGEHKFYKWIKEL
ncbi:MAG: GNAT family N-acetyltransferase [Prevotella sp.]